MAVLQLVGLLLFYSLQATCNVPKCENNPERLLCHFVDLNNAIQPENEPWNVTRLWIRSPPTMKTIDPASLAQLPKLKNLDIQGSQLESLPSGLFAGTMITIVDIRGSPIQNVSAKLLENSTVEIFFFQEQKNLVIPVNQPFLESTTLESLYIDNCAIQNIYPETFRMLPKLSTLSIMENQLTFIPSGAFIPNNALSNLFLERNRLTTLNLNQFSEDSLNSGKMSLYLDGNPWFCNAALQPVMASTKIKINMESTECANPKGKNWAQALEALKAQNQG